MASNDAPCSGVAVLYNEQGVVVKAVLMRRNPDLVVVDTEIIAKAPVRLFAAGLGDALATWFEARACHKSGARTMARGNVSNTALMMSRLCYDLLMEHGVEALEAVRQHTVTKALEDVVEASIYLSGLGFENGGLAAAHAINDGLAQEPQTHGMYHGGSLPTTRSARPARPCIPASMLPWVSPAPSSTWLACRTPSASSR